MVQGSHSCSEERGAQEKDLDEAHTSKYSIHPCSSKMYHGLRVQF
jgi:hypothetical protein